ncbi:MAG: glycosyltransferase [Ignavibacterium sp.]|nr:glycosyltransferase [Ignavibacterium sp.]
MVLIIIIAAILLVYLITIILFKNGLKKVFIPTLTDAINIKVSIVISAKNEERNLENLIKALDEQEYPKEFFEVIIVDDNSKDATLAKTKSLISEKHNFTVISNTNPDLPPKKGALALGIENANNDFILITDADCTPLPGWINTFVSKFRDGYDFIFGIAPFNEQNSSDINSFACFDNLRSTLLTFSASGLGMPFSASARSFGFKKDSFNRIGGYKNTFQTLGGDDDLLLQAAIKNNLSIGTVTDRQAFVYSNSPFTFKEFIAQKKRHIKTSHYYLLKNKLLVGYWHTINLLCFISILLVPFSIYFLALFATKMIADFYTIKNRQSDLAYNFYDYEIPLFQFLYELLVVFHFINSFTTLKRWR